MSRKPKTQQEAYYTLLLEAQKHLETNKILSIEGSAKVLQTNKQSAYARIYDLTGNKTSSYSWFKKIDITTGGKKLKGNPQGIIPDWNGISQTYLDYLNNKLKSNYNFKLDDFNINIKKQLKDQLLITEHSDHIKTINLLFESFNNYLIVNQLVNYSGDSDES